MEAFIQKFLDLTSDHVYIKDLDGIVRACSQAQLNFFSFTHPNQLIGKSDFDITTEEAAKKIQAMDQEVIREKKRLVFEEYFEKEGKRFDFISRKEPLCDETGKIIGIIGVSTNITDQKAREKLEAEKIELLEKNQDTIRIWAAAIAHELRTPLATLDLMGQVMISFVEKVKKDEKLLENSELKRAIPSLERFEKNFPQVVREAHNFIDMALVKVNPNRVMHSELQTLDMKTVIENFLKKYPFRDEGNGKNQRNLVHVNVVKNFSFQGNEDGFYHVLANLMKNAIFYIKAAGKGEIYLEISAGKDYESSNFLFFKDTGSGMPEDVANDLFKAFFSKSKHGTGVGLFLSKNILQEFGATIVCDSKLGEYTTFAMGFPKV